MKKNGIIWIVFIVLYAFCVSCSDDDGEKGPSMASTQWNCRYEYEDESYHYVVNYYLLIGDEVVEFGGHGEGKAKGSGRVDLVLTVDKKFGWYEYNYPKLTVHFTLSNSVFTVNGDQMTGKMGDEVLTFIKK